MAGAGRHPLSSLLPAEKDSTLFPRLYKASLDVRERNDNLSPLLLTVPGNRAIFVIPGSS